MSYIMYDRDLIKSRKTLDVENFIKINDIDINSVDAWDSNNTYLINAVILDKYTIVEKLLEYKNIKINIANNLKMSALLYAVIFNNIPIAKLLVNNKNIDINIKNGAGETPLILAVKNNNISMAELLLTCSDININQKTKYNFSALIISVNFNYIEMVKLLINYTKININSKNHQNYTPLMLAAIFGHTKISKLLLDVDNIDINATDVINESAIFKTVKNNNIDIFNILINRKDIDLNIINKYNWTLISQIAACGNIEMFNRVIDYNIDIFEPLVCASKYGNFEILKTILLNAKNINHIYIRIAAEIAYVYHQKDCYSLLEYNVVINNKIVPIDTSYFNTELIYVNIYEFSKCPLSNKTKKTLSSTRYDNPSSDKCMVCLSELIKDDIIIRLGCQHIFHNKCIMHWFKINNFCPICRKKI